MKSSQGLVEHRDLPSVLFLLDSLISHTGRVLYKIITGGDRGCSPIWHHCINSSCLYWNLLLDYFDTEGNLKTWWFSGRFCSYKEWMLLVKDTRDDILRLWKYGSKNMCIMSVCPESWLTIQDSTLPHSLKTSLLKYDTFEVKLINQGANLSHCSSAQNDFLPEMSQPWTVVYLQSDLVAVWIRQLRCWGAMESWQPDDFPPLTDNWIQPLQQPRQTLKE